MRWNWKYAWIAFVILLVEIAIALFVHDQFIRPFFGDLLVVVLLYFGCRTILKVNAIKLSIGVSIFAFGVEILQFFELATLLGLEKNSVASVVLGSTFDWWDILAYALGAILAFCIDRFFLEKN